MIGKLAQWSSYIAFVAAAWWLWTGPIQDMRTQDSGEKLATWQKQMGDCIKGERYKAGAGSSVSGNPEDVCATKLGFYREDGVWYRTDEPRPH